MVPTHTIHGISPQKLITTDDTMLHMRDRFTLRKAWNGNNAKKTQNSMGRVSTPFRSVMNAGDYLGRTNYSCGGNTQTNAGKPGLARLIGALNSNCDGSGIEPSTCNVKYVYDSSIYITYKRQQAKQRNYNDSSFGN